VLLRSERSALQSETTAANAGLMRLAPGIEQLQLRFSNGSAWRDDWDAKQDSLPRLVELSLAMVDAEGRSHRFFSASSCRESRGSDGMRARKGERAWRCCWSCWWWRC